jgi:hypothetical protein
LKAHELKHVSHIHQLLTAPIDAAEGPQLDQEMSQLQKSLLTNNLPALKFVADHLDLKPFPGTNKAGLVNSLISWVSVSLTIIFFSSHLNCYSAKNKTVEARI